MSAQAAANVPAEHATRNTIQRALVLDSVRHLANHPSSAEVYEEVRRRHPHISRATVYRNLALLSERGDLLHIEVPNGADRYDHNVFFHYHAICRECGSVTDIEMAQDCTASTNVANAHGFVIEGARVVFDGLCGECAKKAIA